MPSYSGRIVESDEAAEKSIIEAGSVYQEASKLDPGKRFVVFHFSN